MTSDVSRRAAALVDERLPQARGLGSVLGDLIDDPEAFTQTLTEGLRELADAAYEQEQERVAPGSGAVLGVRWPLLHAVQRVLRRPLAESSSSSTLWLAQRLVRSEYREVRLFSLPPLLRTLPDDPELAWQLLRKLARSAQDWITVDSLADVYAAGILQAPFRWAEVEQLVYSAHRMERRLVGSTLARMPYHLTAAERSAGGTEELVQHALGLIEQLMGDADDQVQKSLSWALREWSRLAPTAVERTLDAHARIAARQRDGARAWVIRDSLAHVDPRVAHGIRAHLAGIRRSPVAVSTSDAAHASAAFLTAPGSEQLADRAVAMQGERFARRGA